jgi:hypothetical protein
LGVVNHGLMISFITLTCIDGQQFNKQYDHNDFQVDVPDSIEKQRNFNSILELSKHYYIAFCKIENLLCKYFH